MANVPCGFEKNVYPTVVGFSLLNLNYVKVAGAAVQIFYILTDFKNLFVLPITEGVDFKIFNSIEDLSLSSFSSGNFSFMYFGIMLSEACMFMSFIFSCLIDPFIPLCL